MTAAVEPGAPATAPSRRRRFAILGRAGLAVLCFGVLALHTPRQFERVRHRVVTSAIPAEDGTVTVTLPDIADAGAPAAMVVRLRGGAAGSRVTLAIGDRDIGTIEAPPLAVVRADLSLAPLPADGDRLELRGGPGGWSLEYLEIANVFGFTRGVMTIQVVPRGARVPRPVPGPAAAIVSLLAALAAGGAVRRRPLRTAGHALAGLVLVLFVVVLAAPWLSRYALLIAPHSFAICAALLCLPRLAQWTSRLGLRAAAVRPLRVPAASLLPVMVAVLGAALAAVAWLIGSHAAGGADSSGYVSQASLWARGRLTSPEPLVNLLPARLDPAVAAPLGYAPHHAAGHPDVLVPTYSPGLPMVMALLQRLGGDEAAYLAVPLLSGLAVWLTFVLGRRLGGPGVGAIAAVWLAFSPAFLLAMLNPMSDVPVTTWWLLSLVLATAPGQAAAAGAGLATALAVLTRPNLVLLAPIVAAAVLMAPARPPARRRRLLLFGAGGLPGALIVAALFDYWYGSPLKSGYGPLDYLFSTANVLPNLARYPRWFVESQTPLALLALVAPFAARSAGTPEHPLARGMTWLLLVFAAVVWVEYLFYTPFETWDYLRFVLPTYPALLTLAALALAALLRRARWPVTLGLMLVALVAVFGWQYMERKTGFGIAESEARYRRVGEYLGSTLPADAVLLSMQHSGSLRFYTGRPILRYDTLPENRLDDTVATLEAAGRRVYLVLDAWEAPLFRARFAGRSERATLDWTPMAIADGETRVFVYDAGSDRGFGPRSPVIIP